MNIDTPETDALRDSYENYEHRANMEDLWELCASMERERNELSEWKRQQMLLDSQWNEQEVGSLLGMTIGTPIRENILPCLRQQKKDLQTLIAWVDDGGDEDSQHLAACMWAKYPKP